jgi:nucleoside-diphosphate-sugar epimerase
LNSNPVFLCGGWRIVRRGGVADNSMSERFPESGRRILLTGASGFLGRHVASRLLNAGHEVHVLGRHPWPCQTLSDRMVFHEVDLLNARASEWAGFSDIGADSLLHAAWCAQPGVYWTSAENLSWVIASLQLVRTFLAGGGRRVVVVGSCAEYDWAYPRLEEGVTPLAPSTLYGVCKASLHRILDAAATQLDFSFAWGHLFYPYGPHEKPGRLLSDVISRLLAGLPAPCTEGHQIRDFIHIEDAAGALCQLLTTDVRGAVNIASGDARSVREIVQIAAAVADRPDLIRLGAIPTRPGDPTCLAAVVDRLRTEVGYEPRYDPESGIRAAVGWWRASMKAPTAT